MIMDCWGGAKIRCEFSKTQINTDNIVLKTIFHNVPDSTLYVKPETIRKEVEQAFFDAATVLTDFSIKDTVKIDKPYTYLYINPSGKVMAVIDDKGKIKTEETNISATNLKENTLIQGKNGEELVLTKKGQVMGKTEFNATGGNSVLLKEYHRKSDSLAQWQINFLPDTKHQTYAFDYLGSGNHGIFSGADYYPQSGSYDFRYKSVECGKNDKVIVEFDTYPEADSVVFKDKYGVTYPISLKDNVLSFTGVSKADTNFIYAYRGDQKIGKLFLNTYQQKTYKVVLISVNEAKLPNLTDLENDLNKVYNQCAVSFKIETRDLQVSGIENFTHGGTKVAGSVWNASQKAVLEAFGEKYEDNTAYLFFIPKAETGGVAGYMPRYYPYGFIYPGAANRTIAHELGHGIAGLEHPFPESQVSGNTANLMDYRDGEELWHFQWDMLQDPARKIFKWWQNEEDAQAFDLGANIVCITDEEIQKIKATQRYFFIADGRVVDLKDYNPSGFYTKDDKTESARGAVAKIRIDGYDYGMYYNKDTKQVSFFGYNTDPDHAAKKVEVAKLIVNDPEKIKLAQRVFPSEGTCECKNFVTPENDVFKTLYAEMSEEDYTEAVDRLVSRLNQQVSDKDYFIVDGDAGNSNEAKDYRDRFNVFHSATGNSIFVDVCCFNKKPTAEQIANMAQDVFEKSTLKDDDRSIYLVLPVWSEHKIKNNLRSYDKQYFSRSLYTKSQKYSGIANTQEYKSATGNPIDIIDQFYRLVPKPYKLMSYAITYDANILQYPLQQSPSDIIGKSNIYEFELLVDDKLEEYLRFESNIQSLGEQIKRENQYNNGPKIPSYFKNRYDKEIEDFKAFVTEINNSNDYNFSDITHGFFESAIISQENNKPIPLLFAEAYLKNKRAQEVNWLSDKYFIKGVCEIEYQSVKGRIEKISLLLMPFGIDFVTDAIGAIYSGYYGDTETMTVYIIALTIEGVSATVLLKVLEHSSVVNKVTKKIEQRSTKTHTVPTHNLLTYDNFVPKIKKLAKDEASAKALITRVKSLDYKVQDDFLTSFSNLDDEGWNLFLENPNMVDTWNIFRKNSLDQVYRSDVNFLDAMAYYDQEYASKVTFNNISDYLQPSNKDKIMNLLHSKKLELTEYRELVGDFTNVPNYNKGDIFEMFSFISDKELRREMQGKAFAHYFYHGNSNLSTKFQQLSPAYQTKFVKDFEDHKDFVKFVERPELVDTWKSLRLHNNLPDHIYQDIDFIEKLNIFSPDLHLKNIERTFCDDNMSDYLCKQIKENDYSLTEIQALCGDFEHCVKEDGSNLLELYDFVKGGKKNALDNKAFDYYNSEVKTLRQKAIDYFVEKRDDFVNAFVAEVIAYPMALYCTEWFKGELFKDYNPKYDDIFNQMYDFNYFESAIRNALQSLKPISEKNSLKQNIINFVPYFITFVEYKKLLQAIHDNKHYSTLVITTLKCLIAMSMDYQYSKTDTKWGKYIKPIIHQILKDSALNVTDDFLDKRGPQMWNDFKTYLDNK